MQPRSAEDLHAFGRKLRKQHPRSKHATWNPGLRHRDSLTLLRESLRGRLPRLFPLRYRLMAASPFGFFRGAVPVMAYDLSRLPNSGVVTQLCGDAHVRNLGAYAGIDGNLVFDINDFDETLRGPFEWDVKRLSTSLLLAGRAAHIKNSASNQAASHFLERYRKSMGLFADMPVLELARHQVRRLDHTAAVAAVLDKAERSTPLHNLETLTAPLASKQGKHHNKSTASIKSRSSGNSKTSDKSATSSNSEATSGSNTDSTRIFNSTPPTLERVTGSERDAVLDSLTLYRKNLQPDRRHFLDQYRPVDVAFKVVGTGSVGLRDFCVYLEGNGPDDPLFLQIKEEAPSAWTAFVTDPPATPTHQGRRVAEGQRAMQLQSDPFLGWTTLDNRDFLVRQLNDHKGTIDLESLSPEILISYADLCGELLARGHARSGNPAALHGYIGKSPRFDTAILKFSQAYADQTELDWKHLVAAKHL
jgi:uncharacterized protein (DUF2252 family)